MRKLLPALFLIFTVSGCAVTVTPETVNESMATAEYTYQGVVLTLERLVDNGVLVGDRAAAALESLNVAEVAMEAARASLASGSADAPTLVGAASSSVGALLIWMRQNGLE
jgi:hypothetical protein